MMREIILLDNVVHNVGGPVGFSHWEISLDIYNKTHSFFMTMYYSNNEGTPVYQRIYNLYRNCVHI